MPQFSPSVIMSASYLLTLQPPGHSRQQENVIRGRKGKMTMTTMGIKASCQRDVGKLESYNLHDANARIWLH